MAGYTLIDHDITPFSSAHHISIWLERLRKMHDASPEDEGIRSALQEVEMIARERGLDLKDLKEMNP